MIWIFALGIITLAAYHKGFRKVLLWSAAGGSIALVIWTVAFFKG